MNKTLKHPYTLDVRYAYQLGMSHKLPIKHVQHRSNVPFEIVRMDLWDHVLSTLSMKIFLLFFNDCTCFMWIYVMHNKSQTTSIFFLYFDALVEMQLHTKI